MTDFRSDCIRVSLVFAGNAKTLQNSRCTQNQYTGRCLLNVCVIVDVLLTVAVVACAARTVAEFQIRMGNIGSSTDCALMPIGRLFFFWSSGPFLITGGPVGIGTGSVFAPFPLEADGPGAHPVSAGKHIQAVLSEEQEIVCQGNDREEVSLYNIEYHEQ